MSVYDDIGNMTSNRAGALAREISQKVGTLLDALFAEGMTIVEARALLGYLQSEISTTAIMCIMQQQMTRNAPSAKCNVSVLVFNEYPVCSGGKCSYTKECANHRSAGDFRTEDGSTPDLLRTNSSWKCSKQPEQTGRGAVLVDGTHVNDWKYNERAYSRLYGTGEVYRKAAS